MDQHVLLESAWTIEPLSAQLTTVFFLPHAWGNGVVLGVKGVCVELLVGKVYGYLVIVLRRRWWWRRRQRRIVIPEGGGWIDGIGKKGLGMDGGGR
jgi:hypothetical protein